MATVSYINTVPESISATVTTDMSFATATVDSLATVLDSASATTLSTLESATASASESSSSLQTASSTTGLVTNTTATAANSATPSPTNKLASSSSLPTGAIGGIVAGVVVLILIVTAVWLYRIRRSKQQGLRSGRSNESCEKQSYSSPITANFIGILPGINENENGEPGLQWSPRLGSAGFSSTSRLLNPYEGAGAPVSPSSSTNEPQRPSRSRARIFGDTGQPDDLESGHGDHDSFILPNRGIVVSRAQDRESGGTVDATPSLQQSQAEQAVSQDRRWARQKLCQLHR